MVSPMVSKVFNVFELLEGIFFILSFDLQGPGTTKKINVFSQPKKMHVFNQQKDTDRNKMTVYMRTEEKNEDIKKMNVF